MKLIKPYKAPEQTPTFAQLLKRNVQVELSAGEIAILAAVLGTSGGKVTADENSDEDVSYDLYKDMKSLLQTQFNVDAAEYLKVKNECYLNNVW